jgi:hypothetical protein
MSGRILRQYLDDYAERQNRHMRHAHGVQKKGNELGKAYEKAPERRPFKIGNNIRVPDMSVKTKRDYAGLMGQNALDQLDAIADAPGGLRVSKSTRAELENIKATQRFLNHRTDKLFQSASSKSRVRKRQRAVDDLKAQVKTQMENFTPRYHDVPAFTSAQERKMMSPDNSRKLVQQAVSDEPEDRGLIGRFLGN